MNGWGRLKWQQLRLVCLMLAGLMVLYSTHYYSKSIWDTAASSLQEHPGYLVYSSRCRIPDYSVWRDTNRNRTAKQLDHECSGQLLLVEQLFGGQLQLLRHNLKLTEERLGCALSCCLNPIIRAGNDSGQVNERVSICFGEDSDVVRTPHEFVRLQCQCNGQIVYEDFFAAIIRKSKVEARVKKSSIGQKPKALSVYLIGIDSVSRLNLHRYMPRTRELLESLGAVPMTGFTKVGKNTFPNLIPMLTGKDYVKELPEEIMERPLDDIGFIWREFVEAGYRTMYSEDQPQMNTFNFDKSGFNSSPTDYYMRPMFTVMASGSNKRFCVNNRLEASFMIDWLKKFIRKFPKEPQFALTLSNYVHSAELHKLAPLDPIYEHFFNWYSRSDRFNSSMLVFFSDHGKRFGSVMKTEVGRFESRTPFFYILLPPWYARVYPDRVHALRTNSRRLTTMYDMHTTMLQLLEDAGPQRTAPRPAHGISLLSEVPEDRSCRDAHIDTQWCVCGTHRHLQFDEYDRAAMKRVAQLAVDDMNTVRLAAVRDRCAHLEFLSLPEVYIQTELPQMEDHSIASSDVAAETVYVLILTTVPGYGQFEAHMQQSGTPVRWTVLGFNRLDAYGNQSSCLSELFSDEQRFCFCV